MSTVAVVLVAFLAMCVLLAAVGAWRDVRIARWTQQDPRADRKARRDAATWVQKTTSGPKGGDA